MTAALLAGCANNDPNSEAQALLAEAVAVTGDVEAVEGTLTYQQPWPHGEPLEPVIRWHLGIDPGPSVHWFTVDAAGDVSARTSLNLVTWPGGSPFLAEDRTVDGAGYLLLPVPGPRVGLEPGPVWQYVQPPGASTVTDDAVASSPLSRTVCVLALHAFPAAGCNPLSAVAELAATGIAASVVSEAATGDLGTAISFKVPLQGIATVDELAELRTELGPAVLGQLGSVGLDMTIWVDAQSRITGARFDARQMQTDIMRAAGMPHKQAADAAGGLEVVLTFDTFGAAAVDDVAAPHPSRVLASFTEVSQRLMQHDTPDRATTPGGR